jgi:hypothetical protein
MRNLPWIQSCGSGFNWICIPNTDSQANFLVFQTKSHLALPNPDPIITSGFGSGSRSDVRYSWIILLFFHCCGTSDRIQIWSNPDPIGTELFCQIRIRSSKSLIRIPKKNRSDPQHCSEYLTVYSAPLQHFVLTF